VQGDRGPGENLPYSVVYASVAEAREKQQHAITMGNVDDELKYSHQVTKGTGRTLVPKPWDNERFLHVQPRNLEGTLTRVFERPELFGLSKAL
jgi:hypothetical protein